MNRSTHFICTFAFFAFLAADSSFGASSPSNSTAALRLDAEEAPITTNTLRDSCSRSKQLCPNL
jgi:hypothetical protein